MVAQPAMADIRVGGKRRCKGSRLARPNATAIRFADGITRTLAHGLRNITLGRINVALGVLIGITAIAWIANSLVAAVDHSSTVRVMNVKVESGDTLWRIADRYGDPDQYILQRVHTLAAENHINPGAKLQPGTELRVRVVSPNFKSDAMTASAK